MSLKILELFGGIGACSKALEKQAGNSIVVNVLEAILNNLLLK